MPRLSIASLPWLQFFANPARSFLNAENKNTCQSKLLQNLQENLSQNFFVGLMKIIAKLVLIYCLGNSDFL